MVYRSKSQSLFRQMVSSLLLVSFYLQLVGCQSSGEEKVIAEGFSNLISIFENDLKMGKVSGSELRLNRAKKAFEFAEKADVLAGTPPALDGKLTADSEEAKNFVLTNQVRIDAWLNEFDLQVKGLRQQ
ncbi:MAG: hypothetical protein AABZ55_02205, partial [Bdellovibrionota bacterium]